MSVRQSLLAILDQGPCYGYQLRTEFDRRTGSTWPLNVGQIYNTLDRLERDGLVTKGDVDAQGHVYWQITDAGTAEVRDWWDSPVERSAGSRDELAIKLAVAATLPGVDVAGVIQSQRAASTARLTALQAAERRRPRAGECRTARARTRDGLRGVLRRCRASLARPHPSSALLSILRTQWRWNWQRSDPNAADLAARRRNDDLASRVLSSYRRHPVP